MIPTLPIDPSPNVVALDPYLIGFIKNNLVTLGSFLGLLKGIAKITPSTTDDKIVTLLTNFVSSFKPGKKEDPAQPAPEKGEQ